MPAHVPAAAPIAARRGVPCHAGPGRRGVPCRGWQRSLCPILLVRPVARCRTLLAAPRGWSAGQLDFLFFLAQSRPCPTSRRAGAGRAEPPRLAGGIAPFCRDTAPLFFSTRALAAVQIRCPAAPTPSRSSSACRHAACRMQRPPIGGQDWRAATRCSGALPPVPCRPVHIAAAKAIAEDHGGPPPPDPGRSAGGPVRPHRSGRKRGPAGCAQGPAQDGGARRRGFGGPLHAADREQASPRPAAPAAGPQGGRTAGGPGARPAAPAHRPARHQI